MATLHFETLPSDQLLGLDPADIIFFAGGPAFAASVIYNPSANGVATISVAFNGHGATFDQGLLAVSANHNLHFNDGTALLIGGQGADSLVIGLDGGAAFGGAGDDIIDSRAAGSGRNLIQGNQGNDTISCGDGADTIFGGQGGDLIFAGGDPDDTDFHTFHNQSNFAQGNLGNDTIYGGERADTLLGGQGDDVIFGIAGDDFLNGDLGNDFIVAGAGAARMFGEDGNDTLTAEGSGATTMSGGKGDDSLSGGGGVDVLNGDLGNDFIVSRGGSEPDGGGLVSVTQLFGEDGADTLVAQTRDLFLSGGAGEDLFSFQFSDPDDVTTFDATIIDWAIEDHISVANLGASPNYVETTASLYPDAVTAANAALHAGADIVVVQVRGDVFAFFQTGGGPNADLAIHIVGRSLADIGPGNFI